jgi:hypothetical protein
MLTLPLSVRAPILFYVIYCSAGRACSNLLPCGEALGSRFYWDTL